MKVVAADWLPYCLPLRRPWQTSRGTLNERHGRLRRLTTDDGRTGWGDCAPLPEFGIAEASFILMASILVLVLLYVRKVGTEDLV